MRIAGAEGLRHQRRHCGKHAHAEGEADEIDRASQGRSGKGFAPEPPDEGEIGRHHRLVAELRQRHRRGQPERFGELEGEVISGWLCELARRAWSGLVEQSHGTILASPRRSGLAAIPPARSRRVTARAGPDRGRQFSHTSTLALSELSWMNSRRGSTTSPINLVKMSSASSTSLIFTCKSERSLVSRVVSHNCDGFISPRPL